MKNKRNHVFVSYSHKDHRWLDRLRVHLRPLIREDELDLWDDFRIDPGTNWRNEIQQAIDKANVAILLISADFLASDFISNNELPPLLEKAKNDGTIILPVIVSPCRFGETKNISHFQAVNDPSQPLSSQSKTKQEKVFVELSKHTEKALSKLEMDDIEKEIFELNQNDSNSFSFENTEQEFAEIFNISRTIFEETMKSAVSNDGSKQNISTGFRDLDYFTSGFEPSELIAVFAKPYTGLTAFGISVALNSAILENRTVAFFSMEVSKEKMVRQMISAEARVDVERFIKGYLTREEWERMRQALATFSETKIFIDDSHTLSIEGIRDKLKNLPEGGKLDLVIIDNIRHISASQKSNDNQPNFSQISLDLRGLAKEFKVPIVVLCKLSSKIETGLWNRPVLSDLSQFGSMDGIADFNIIIHREEFYRPTEENGGIAEIKVVKVHNGATYNFNLAFLKEFNRFENYFDPSK